MRSEELSKIVWAQSFVSAHITDPPTKEEASDEYLEQLLIAWQILSQGVDKLREENTKLINALAFINQAAELTR
jgi:ribosomal protein L16 Arg81 hydroxylase